MSMVAISKSYEEGGFAEYGGPKLSGGAGETGRDIDISDGAASDGVVSDGIVSGWKALGFSAALACQATYTSARSAKNGLQFACSWAKRSQ